MSSGQARSTFEFSDEAPLVERKVTFASAGAYLVFVVLAYAADVIVGEPVLVTPLPDWLEPPVLALLPMLGALAAGYAARHTPRPDLPAHKR